MFFVKRNDSGNIVAISLSKADGFVEESHVSSDELRAFTENAPESTANVKQVLEASDTELARVTEDLIHLLIEKQLILFTELPLAVQEKLQSRDKLRKSLQANTPSIMDDAGSI